MAAPAGMEIVGDFKRKERTRHKEGAERAAWLYLLLGSSTVGVLLRRCEAEKGKGRGEADGNHMSNGTPVSVVGLYQHMRVQHHHFLTSLNWVKTNRLSSSSIALRARSFDSFELLT